MTMTDDIQVYARPQTHSNVAQRQLQGKFLLGCTYETEVSLGFLF
jgi:hypothetical protein